MLINAPVYTLQNNTHFVNMYMENEDGTFNRTQNEPLRLLRDDFAGISMSQGELVSHHFDRGERDWSTATISYHYGRPQSFYQFLREMVARNKFFVFSKPVLSGHLIKFDLHELRLKNSMSQRKMSILKEKYIEALDLWTKEEYEQRQQQAQQKRVQQQSTPPKQQSAKTKLVSGLPPRSQQAASVVDGSQVVAFKSKETGATNSTPLALQLEDSPVTINWKHESDSNEDNVVQENENPFAEKSIFRHSHFLQRFIFHRR